MNTDSISPAAAGPEQILSLIRTDLLDRGEHFVFQRKEGRRGWEDALPKGSAYSEAVLSKTAIEDSLTNAYKHATSMLTAMDLPVPVRVTIDSSEASGYTDGETVCVSTKMFDDKSLTMGQKLDVFTGLTVHEGCHVLYTDFRKGRVDDPALMHSLWNIIEDERIERKCGYDTPGLANFLAMAKYYFFGRVNTDKLPDGRMERLVNTILGYVRYPSTMQDGDILEFADVMLAVRDVLTPFPASNAEARDAARKIYELIKDEAAKKDPDEGEGKGSGKGESEKGESGKGEDGKGEKNGEKDEAKGKDASRPRDGEGERRDEKEVNDILASIADRVSKLTRSSRHMKEEDECSAIRRDRKIAKIVMGEMERGARDGNTFVSKSQTVLDTRAEYQLALSRVRHLIPATRKALICNAADRVQPLTGLRHGKLDTGKLAEGFQGSDTIYSTRRIERSEKLAVCVLVDESGSMHGEKIAMARDAAVLLNEALSGIPGIEYFLYGHTADTNGRGSVDINVYKEGKSNRFLAGNIAARANNADGYAILEVADRVRKRTAERCLMIVLSDGEPAACAYSRVNGEWHTREAVKKVEAMGFIPIQVSILSPIDPSTMFDHYMKVDDLDTLPKTLAAIVKKTVTGGARKVSAT